ncbi:phosphotransferase family protein [Mucilaginibacter gossypiicola]|nr:aminoglycoside phosphotransferase family protein [Mucilaginibacter gossypiicola]
MIEQKIIRDIVKENFDEDVIEISTIYAGGMNFVYEVIFGHQTIMLKAYPSVRSSIAATEFEILLSGKKNGVLLPEPFFFGKKAGKGYLAYKKIEGTNLNFDLLAISEQQRFCADLVQNIAQLAKISFQYFGNITEEKKVFASWPAFLLQNIDSGLLTLREGKFIPEASLQKLTEFMLSHRLLNETVMPCLVWGDLKSENILVSNGSLAALLDFESCFSGDPLLSFGYLFAREGDSRFYKTSIAAFRRLQSFSDEDIYFYALFRFLRISKYLGSPLPTGKIREPVLNYFPGIQKILNLFKNQ